MLPKRPPMVFHSEVKKGHLPVVNATVTAVLYHPESGEEIRLDLMDQGDGGELVIACLHFSFFPFELSSNKH